MNLIYNLHRCSHEKGIIVLCFIKGSWFGVRDGGRRKRGRESGEKWSSF